jgi:hypothetical protein
MSVLQSILEAFSMAFGMFWEILWALILGFAIDLPELRCPQAALRGQVRLYCPRY